MIGWSTEAASPGDNGGGAPWAGDAASRSFRLGDVDGNMPDSCETANETMKGTKTKNYK
jgi:hypothetical protein